MNWIHLFRDRPAAPVNTLDVVPRRVQVLLISADRNFRARFERAVRDSRWELRTLDSVVEAASLMAPGTKSLVVYDWETLDGDWSPGLQALKSMPGQTCVFLVSRSLDNNLWQEVIRLGGYDVLARSADSEEIKRNIAFAWFWSIRPRTLLGDAKEITHS